ncbi:aldo/keto reductase [Paenibacillus aurantius]|uniref:Aldo/keto reductase n=1 Tax=Paenibacillus aurantius TaxID=2918900 RepID=A0AA96LGA9_9BACL|nr:aldo/keto reductase [Paenibacillus aurantius]WNQ12758.1 aldo/keto reductase [Paenibacillus aurantius]
MERRRFGQTDMDVSILGFGGAEIGFAGASPETVDKLLGSALDAGLNVIDTAECYNTSEELIGKTISKRRGDYYLFTKCGHASGFDRPDWDPAMLAESIDRSLKRLNTDYVDLIHLHSCSEDILRQGDVIDVLKRAKEAGKTRYIGYSGENEAALFAVQTGAFDSLQTSINIADQRGIDRILPEARERGMGVIAKRPIANAAWKTGTEPPSEKYHQVYWERLRELNYDFLTRGLEESVGIALRFTLSLPGVHTAIVGTNNPGRWGQNAELLVPGKLSDDQMEEIRLRWKEKAGDDWVGQV